MLKLTELFIHNAELQWPKEGTPYSPRFDDVYFSRQGGLEETEYVFIQANKLVERWQALEQELQQGTSAKTTFTIAELGFGTGLNLLCTWRHWLAIKPEKMRLHFISCEKYPMGTKALETALSQWPELQALSQELLANYPDHSPGYHRLVLRAPGTQKEIILDLYYGDACELLTEQIARSDTQVDAWFLDGFAPRSNPDMWSEGLFERIAALSKKGTTLATYSVAGPVVRGLRAAGFEVSKAKGFGHKRHMLHGLYDAQNSRHDQNPAKHNVWLRPPATTIEDKRAIIIGAGVAGCSTANALARRGYQVTLVDRAEDIAQGASGNRQAVLQCRLNNALNETWLFNLSAFIFAGRSFNQLSRENPDFQWQQCGVLNLDTAFSSRNKRCAPVKLELYAADIVQRLEQEQASEAAGIPLDGAANLQRLGGWVNPKALCQSYISHPNITVLSNTCVEKLEKKGNLWSVSTHERELAKAPFVIVANSVAAMELEQTSAIRLIPLRGQVSYVKASEKSTDLKSVVCGMSYISPSFEGLHSAGASYSKSVDELSLSQKEHEENIEGIAPHLPSSAITVQQIETGRVSVRAGSPDRMPIAGPVHDYAQLEQDYLSLGHRDKQSPENIAPYLEGLYLNVGHGSHGFTNAPLIAEYLASLINQELSPLPQSVAQFIHPARFLLRELKRR
ncbi:MAG: bifunctional tRNA (5-methylaminomethyl-2-thiouridine)(34)-methyltransferase MnmD/FAD-dependent 5-carboxymethylaminomethyl-2-thiouridine(34) oxidoreductase MnmC [Pseudohongiellaceae bacterium]|nr:bifunctional tRNA (5-methylaminomethyl-2-thiouridine)(34)-methyltransferase MnmD/FAD-dependent 5-carboxymethylaminomethyl-2-thiouridine(34) oxidoreductase MnmC [Pseudohongiellaceae bacterium]